MISQIKISIKSHAYRLDKVKEKIVKCEDKVDELPHSYSNKEKNKNEQCIIYFLNNIEDQRHNINID